MCHLCTHAQCLTCIVQFAPTTGVPSADYCTHITYIYMYKCISSISAHICICINALKHFTWGTSPTNEQID